MSIVCFVKIIAALTTAIAFGTWQDNFSAGIFMFFACSLYQYENDLSKK